MSHPAWGFDREYFQLAGVYSSRPFMDLRQGLDYITGLGEDYTNQTLAKDWFICAIQIAWDYWFGGIDEEVLPRI